ncbi:hypothetical protein ANN_13985 [Periplaneta americana]|uniref:Reverse transcriptase domain-containing protein n=1 Tax=Periplaneta americana TaxID=6978 RepID=A0ABQ8SWE5_PERAM|nr:hypothetical protein ANN_13985 [Periplaneta americana]
MVGSKRPNRQRGLMPEVEEEEEEEEAEEEEYFKHLMDCIFITIMSKRGKSMAVTPPRKRKACCESIYALPPISWQFVSFTISMTNMTFLTLQVLRFEGLQFWCEDTCKVECVTYDYGMKDFSHVFLIETPPEIDPLLRALVGYASDWRRDRPEDNLQRGLYTLNKILKDFGMEISAQKSKVMAFLGQDPVRSKIIHNNQCLEQVQNFNYLICEISYQNEKDENNKITNFTQILGIINKTLKAKLVQKSTRIKIYNTLALPSLLYGSEIWALKKKDMNRIKATEMKFFRTAGYTLLDRKRNEEILEQLEVESVEEKIKYKFNWLDHVRKMVNSRIPKIMMQYKPRGHRRPGRPFRRLLDGAETGLQRPNS